jgi:heme A synthase
MNRPDLIVEVSHRYLASILSLTVATLVLVAWRGRGAPGIGGPGGAVRTASGALLVVFGEALLGALTVKESNAAWATVAHLIGAMTVIALLAATVIRAGGLGGTSVMAQHGSPKTMRGAFAAAALALAAVMLGGLTAKTTGAAIGCLSFPLCGPNPAISNGVRGIQLLHRTLAFLLVAHVLAMAVLLRRRRAAEAAVVVRAAVVLAGLVLTQVVVAAAMIETFLPPALRSMHEAMGVAVWLGAFTFAYLARRAAR